MRMLGQCSALESVATRRKRALKQYSIKNRKLMLLWLLHYLVGTLGGGERYTQGSGGET